MILSSVGINGTKHLEGASAIDMVANYTRSDLQIASYDDTCLLQAICVRRQLE
jgi:hypothetical protein